MGGAPAPGGIHGPMTMTSKTDMKIAFEMLDENREGSLDRTKARCWLRCMGWCVPDEELDDMLSAVRETSGISKVVSSKVRQRWGLNMLEEVLDRNRHRQNSSKEELEMALRRLANNRAKI